MTDALLVTRKLGILRDHVARCRRCLTPSLDAFADDVDLQDATAMSLLVATQEAVDVALHLAADEKWGIPQCRSDTVDRAPRTSPPRRGGR